MQTLKTAIVVVLLLTVTYSAYVALTAPTPELPAEVASLVEGGSFDLGDIGMGEIDAGPHDPTAVDSHSHPSAAAGDASATARLSDQSQLSPSDIAASGPAIAPGAFDSPSPAAPQSLPKPDPSAGPVSADPQQDYPRTPYANFDLDAANDSLGPAEAPSPDSGAPMADGVAAAASSEPSATGAPDSATGAPNSAPAAGSGDAGESLAADDAAAAAAASDPPPGLVNAIATADRQWENDQLREALTTLSLFYNDPNLQPVDREPLQARLDMLAGEVIYSSRHLLEQPYRVSQGETLQSIAATYEVPWQLLANINQVEDPAAIVPGQELKIMRGPFRAEINLERSELTLFLGELYAGRFPVSLGSDPAPQPGTYTVEEKQTARTYYPLKGAHIPAGDPRNPYGGMWLDLGNQMCIHGSPKSPDGAASGATAGCIRLRTADAGDVYGILSPGSAVSIMR